MAARLQVEDSKPIERRSPRALDRSQLQRVGDTVKRHFNRSVSVSRLRPIMYSKLVGPAVRIHERPGASGGRGFAGDLSLAVAHAVSRTEIMSRAAWPLDQHR